MAIGQVAIAATRFRWTRALLVAIACLGATASAGILDRVSRRPPPPSTDDLALTEEERISSEAFAHFAVAVYLEQHADRPAEDYLEHYQQALKLRPDVREFLGYLGRPLTRAKDLESLIEYLEPIARENPEQAHLHLVLSELLMATDRAAEAYDVVVAASEALDWTNAELLRRYVRLCWQLDRFDEPLRILRKALHKPELKGSFLLYFTMAEHYTLRWESDAAKELPEWKRERLRNRAIRYAREAAVLEDRVNYVTSLGGLARLLVRYGEWETLANTLSVVRERPEFDLRPLRILLGRALTISGRTAEAVEVLDPVLKDPLLPPATVWELVSILQECRAHKRALKLCERLLERERVPADVLVRAAFLYIANEDPDSSIALLKKARIEDLRAMHLLSVAYQEKQMHEDAYDTVQPIQDLLKKADKQPEESMLLHLATLCEEAGRIDQAIAIARRAVERFPDSSLSANFLGYVLADHDRELEEAETLILFAIGKQPDSPAILDSLAWVQYRLGRHNDALETILKALRREAPPADGVILDHAGDICRACGLPKLAERYWREALHAERINDDLREAIRAKLEAAPGV